MGILEMPAPLTVEEVLYYLLSTNTDIKAIVGKAISPSVADKCAGDHWIVYHRISNERVASHDGYDGLSCYRYQIDVWSTSAVKRRQLRDLVISTLDEILEDVQGTEVHFQHDNDSDTFEKGPPDRFGANIDFMIWI